MFNQDSVQGQRFQRIILILCFIFLTIALIIAWNSPATGFESSIYLSTPLVLWLTLILSGIVGISIIVFSASKSNFEGNCLWKYGFFLIFLCFAICLSLFIIRGYYLWCIYGDPATHIGLIKEILTEGYTPDNVIYPITHIFLSEISLISTLNPFFLSKCIPLLFGLLCVGFVYILVRSISTNPIEPVIAVIICCTFTIGWYLNLTPNGLANLFFPLVLFLMLKYLNDNSISWGILLCIIIILYPVFHPVPAIFLGLTFLTLWIPDRLSNLRLSKGFYGNIKNTFNLNQNDLKIILPILILGVWFIFWLSGFQVWGAQVSDVYGSISSEKTDQSQLTSVISQISTAQSFGYNVGEFFLKQYGEVMLLLFFSLISFFMLWQIVLTDQKRKQIFSLYGPLGVVCITILVLYITNISLSPLRFFVYLSIFGLIFSAYFFSYILIKNQNSEQRIISKIKPVLVILILTGFFISGMLNLYPSPYNMGMNYQTTRAEVSGMQYFFDKREVTIPVSGFTEAPARFAAVFLTPQDKVRQQLPYYFQGSDKIPWHFGYNQYSSIAFSYNKETNLIINQLDRVMYTDYFPDMAKNRFRSEDFMRLDIDNGIDQLYSNGEFDLYRIIPFSRGSKIYNV